MVNPQLVENRILQSGTRLPMYGDPITFTEFIKDFDRNESLSDIIEYIMSHLGGDESIFWS